MDSVSRGGGQGVSGGVTPDWQALRDEFPALRGRCYLNTATFGQLPQRGMDAVAGHFAHRNETACATFLNWFDDHDRLREKLARLVACSPGDVCFLQNASSALGLLMNGVDWREGDEVLTLEGEFPNNVYAPAHLARHGVRLIETGWPELLERVTERTRLVCVSTVNYVTGFRCPIEEAGAELQRRGVLVYVDGTQSVGALRFDCAAWMPDLLAVNCYKWMLTPNGAAFAVVHPALRQRLEPMAVGWRSHFDWRNVDNLHHGEPSFKESAEKYEGGMLPSSLLYALEAVVDLMLEAGPERIEARVLELAQDAEAVLERHGGVVLYRGSGIISARFAEWDAPALARALFQQGVHVSARHGLLRVSTHFYNDRADLERLSAGLEPVRTSAQRTRTE